MYSVSSVRNTHFQRSDKTQKRSHWGQQTRKADHERQIKAGNICGVDCFRDLSRLAGASTSPGDHPPLSSVARGSRENAWRGDQKALLRLPVDSLELSAVLMPQWQALVSSRPE